MVCIFYIHLGNQHTNIPVICNNLLIANTLRKSCTSQYFPLEIAHVLDFTSFYSNLFSFCLFTKHQGGSAIPLLVINRGWLNVSLKKHYWTEVRKQKTLLGRQNPDKLAFEQRLEDQKISIPLSVTAMWRHGVMYTTVLIWLIIFNGLVII